MRYVESRVQVSGLSMHLASPNGEIGSSPVMIRNKSFGRQGRQDREKPFLGEQ